jgi:excisionase family DNA binding protein
MQLLRPMLTPEAVANALSLHEEHVRKLIRTGQIKAVKAGRHWRVSPAELDRLSAEGWNSLMTPA